jgi:hypothetical protein
MREIAQYAVLKFARLLFDGGDQPWT